MNRYEDADFHEMLHAIRAEHFPALRNAKIKVLYDLKKSVKAGVITLAKIVRPNDLIKHFTKDEARDMNGADYIIVVDKVCWTSIGDEDRARIIRHELQHAYFDIEADEPYKLVDHDVTDFHAEIIANQGDPKWRERCASLTSAIYAQMKESGKKVQSKITPIERLAEGEG